MHEERPSQTASFVAMTRAHAHDGSTSIPNFSDPFAQAMLSRGWSLTYAGLRRATRRMKPHERKKAISRIDVTPLRVVAIDAEVERAVASGCRQLVILGAGLDTRAFRLRALAGVSVYEVDHPATQAYKRHRAQALPIVAKSLHFVPVNFEEESLSSALSAAGYRDTEPTVWLWEGVVMYLTDDALRATLNDVARHSAPGSRLLIHYHTRQPPKSDLLVKRVLLTLWREPQIGERDEPVMQREVRDVGFAIESDTQPSEWAARFGARAPVGNVAEITHLLVARRD